MVIASYFTETKSKSELQTSSNPTLANGTRDRGPQQRGFVAGVGDRGPQRRDVVAGVGVWGTLHMGVACKNHNGIRAGHPSPGSHFSSLVSKNLKIAPLAIWNKRE